MATELAVVAGATGALGSAIVRRLRAEGLTVLAVARSQDALDRLADAGEGIVALAADLADDSAVDAISGALDDLDAAVRIVVQAAGLPGSGTIETITPAEIAAGIDAKIGGFLRLVRATGTRLVNGSRIVVLGGHYGYEPSQAAPLAGIANAGLANLVRSLADHWGPKGVTVHLVAPGPVESPRMQVIAERAAERRGTTADAVLGEYRASSPLGRLTTIEEVAWAVGLLLAPEAASLHGSTLSLDLGRRRGIG